MEKSLPYVNLEELRKVVEMIDAGMNRHAMRAAIAARVHYFEEMHARIDRESAEAPAPGDGDQAQQTEFTDAVRYLRHGAVKTAERPPTLELVK